MRRALHLAWLLALSAAAPLAGQQPLAASPDGQDRAIPECSPIVARVAQEAPAGPAWETVWGLAGLRIFADGPKVAPNGDRYHPSFTLDMDANIWLWRSQGIYLFSDMRFWGQRPENNVTNGRDGGLGFSKRQYDLAGGVAWNYAGAWEARVSGYSMSNLNRGRNLVTPYGINDGALLENRYYLSEEYARLGQTGFDVARATFVSLGCFPTKELIGNDGELFKPFLMARAYLTCDLGKWPCYAYADVTCISDRQVIPRLLLIDTGLAARIFSAAPQWEFRLGGETTADVRTRSALNLWYLAARYIF